MEYNSNFKVPLDPKGRFHSEAEKECSKFFQSANAFVKAAARHPKGWRLLPKGRKKAERKVPSSKFKVQSSKYLRRSLEHKLGRTGEKDTTVSPIPAHMQRAAIHDDV